MSEQLAISFGLHDDATFESYYPGKNQQLCQSLKKMAEGWGDRFLYLWGHSGVGCTHLLQAACHHANRFENKAVYLPLCKMDSWSFGIFEGLEELTLVCIDDVDRLAGKTDWEEALFYLFNRIQSRYNRLVVTSALPIKEVPFNLPDLASRLSSGVTYQVHSLSDDEKIMALQLRAQSRGLSLDESVGRFLLRRCARTLCQLFALLERLDQASLAEKRRLTIPFVKQVLQL